MGLITEEKFENLDILKFGNTIQISGVICSGEGKNYLCVLPMGGTDFNEWILLKPTLEEWERFFKQADLMETEILQLGPQGITKAIFRKSQRQLDSALQWQVFKRDEYKCSYCGRDGLPLTVDHLMIWEEGGPTIPANLLTACKNCNKSRGKTHFAEWLESTHYKRVSQNLTQEQREYHRQLISKINFPPVQHIRSR